MELAWYRYDFFHLIINPLRDGIKNVNMPSVKNYHTLKK
jgi:hypothetical protein